MKISLKHFILPLLFFCLELLIALNQSIWLDESFTLHTTSVGFVETLNRAVVFEAQPVAYFAIMNLWRELNSSIFFARLFSIIMATAAVIIFQAFAERRLKTVNHFTLTALFALNPMLVWAGLEIRMYAMFILLSTALMSLFYTSFLSDRHTRGLKIGFSLLALVAVHTHYYVAFLLLLCFIYLVMFKRAELKAYLMCMLLPVLSLLIYVPNLNSQVAVHKVSGSGSMLYDLGYLWYDMLRSFLITFPDYFTPNIWNMLVILVCVVGLAFFGLRNWKNVLHVFANEGKLPAFLFIGLTLVFSLLLVTLGTAAISKRHMVLFIAPLIICFGLLIYAIDHKHIRNTVLLIVFVLYAFNISGKLPSFGKDMALMEIEEVILFYGKSSEPKLFYAGEYALVYEDLTGDSAVYDLPGTIDLKAVYHQNEWFIKDEEQLGARFNEIDRHGIVWLVDNELDVSYTEFMENRFQTKVNHEILNAYVKANYHVLFCDTVGGVYRIRKLERK